MAVLLWVVAVALLVLTVVDPRRLWYATSAWQFKHPQANEPSATSFAAGRVVSGVAAAGFAVAAVVTTAGAVAPLSQERLDSAGQAAARDLSGSFGKYGAPGVATIREAIDRDDVRVQEGRTVTGDADLGDSYEVREYYELVGVEDASVAGCVEIAYQGGLFHDGDVDVSATYSPGGC